MADDPIPNEYPQLLDDLKMRIAHARVRAGLAVNRELVELYFEIGREILMRQDEVGWGGKVVERLAEDLRAAFPGMRGLSRTNLLYMRAFAAAYEGESIVQQAVGQIPWGHNLLLLDKLADRESRLWYAARAIEHGWSRNALAMHIDGRLREREGKAISNFERTLPAPNSDLASELVKDPYNFDFLGLGADAHERQIERGLIEHVRRFLLELGSGFAFVGSQYPLDLDGEEFFIDLLFYHVKLHCYVVVELKAGKFRPEHAGKMNFYLSVVDDLVRDAEVDQPSIGILLCRDRSKLVVEYALRDMNKPVGVSTYFTETLPAQLAASLPSVDEIDHEFGNADEDASEAD